MAAIRAAITKAHVRRRSLPRLDLKDAPSRTLMASRQDPPSDERFARRWLLKVR